MIASERKFYIKDGDQRIHYKDFIFQAVKKSFGITGDFYQDDLYFIFPFVNQALALLAGIENAFSNSNFLVASNLTRSLIDCTMSLVYMTQVSTDDYQDFISEFCKTGELTKRAVDGEARRRLSGTDLTKSFKKCIGYDLSNPYKQLSKTVHATIFHMHANTQLVPGTDDSVEIRIYGEKLEYPQRLYDELRGLVEVCINTIEQVLASRYTQHEKGDSHEYL